MRPYGAVNDSREKPRIYFRVHFVARRIAGAGRMSHGGIVRPDEEIRTRIISCRIPIYSPSRSRASRAYAFGVRASVCGTTRNASHARVHAACTRLASDACTRRGFLQTVLRFVDDVSRLSSCTYNSLHCTCNPYFTLHVSAHIFFSQR